MTDVDVEGHDFGTESPQSCASISCADDIIKSLLGGLRQHNLIGAVNLAIVSDRGMEATSRDQKIELDNLVDKSDFDGIYCRLFRGQRRERYSEAVPRTFRKGSQS